MSRPRCTFCGLAHIEGLFARGCYYHDLRQALDGVELTPDEDKFLRWLAGWDNAMVAISLIRRLRVK